MVYISVLFYLFSGGCAGASPRCILRSGTSLGSGGACRRLMSPSPRGLSPDRRALSVSTFPASDALGTRSMDTKYKIKVITARIRRMGKVIFSLCVSVHTSTGGGVPGPGRGGTRSSHGQWGGGGSRSQIFRGRGSQVSMKGKIFDTRFGLIHVQTGGKKFLLRDPPPPQ